MASACKSICTLSPVPALRIVFHVPNDSRGVPPRLEQSAFDGMTGVDAVEYSNPSPTVWELSGIPAGHYNISLGRGEFVSQLNGVDLSKDEEVVDATKAESVSSVKIKAQIPGETSTPPDLIIGMRIRNKQLSGWKKLDAKGEAELESIPAGTYELVAWGQGKLYDISQCSGGGRAGFGPTVEIARGKFCDIIGYGLRRNRRSGRNGQAAGNGFAGAMIVLRSREARAEPRSVSPRSERPRRNLQPSRRVAGSIQDRCHRRRMGPGLVAARGDRGLRETRKDNRNRQPAAHESYGYSGSAEEVTHRL